MNDHPIPYRWQDHVITPQRTAANLMATVLIVLVLSAVGLFKAVCAVDPPSPIAHVAISECTPPLSQLAKRPARHHSTQDLM